MQKMKLKEIDTAKVAPLMNGNALPKQDHVASKPFTPGMTASKDQQRKYDRTHTTGLN